MVLVKVREVTTCPCRDDLTPEIEKALKSDGNEGFIVSCQSARNPQLASVTHTHRVIEMSLPR